MSKKPSILFITTDEQHVNTISAFGASSHATPAIDALIERGTVCNNAYSISPVCLPSRCSWMTGLSPHCSGSISNQFGASLSLQYPNLFTELKKQGYRTSMHGKCHFVPVPYPATRADTTLEYEHIKLYYTALGMDHLDLQDDKNNSLWYYDDYAKEMENAGYLTEYRRVAHQTPDGKRHFTFPGPAEMHPDSWVKRKAIEHLDGLSGETPHFMWVSFSGPHYPVDPPAEYLSRVDMAKAVPRVRKPGEWDDRTKFHHLSYHGPGGTEGSGGAADGAQKNYTEQFWTEWRRAYFANVVQIDHQIGEIVRSARAKWGDDLMIVFASDHGDMAGNHDLWGKNRSLAEDVVRVPLVVEYPGQTRGVQTNALVSSLELFPTILDAAGAPIPPCDGRPLKDVIESGGREHVLSVCDNRVMVMQNSVKLIWNRDERTGTVYRELYDLRSDPHEFENLFDNGKYASERDGLEQLLARHESERRLLSTAFYRIGEGQPYWLNDGNGAGLGVRVPQS